MDYTFKLDAKGATAPDATATSETMLQAPPKMLITVSPNPVDRDRRGRYPGGRPGVDDRASCRRSREHLVDRA